MGLWKGRTEMWMVVVDLVHPERGAKYRRRDPDSSYLLLDMESLKNMGGGRVLGVKSMEVSRER
jgi:hypothetical protein